MSEIPAPLPRWMFASMGIPRYWVRTGAGGDRRCWHIQWLWANCIKAPLLSNKSQIAALLLGSPAPGHTLLDKQEPGWILALNLHAWPSSLEKGTSQAISRACGHSQGGHGPLGKIQQCMALSVLLGQNCPLAGKVQKELLSEDSPAHCSLLCAVAVRWADRGLSVPAS